MTEALHDLLARTADRDSGAFRTLYRDTAPLLFGMALRLLGRRELAETALENCFVRIWESADRYRADRHEPLAWIVAVLRAHALDLKRGMRQETDDTGRVPDADLEDSSVATAFDGPLGLPTDDDRQLGRCLARVPDRPRECLLLAYREGRSPEELGEALDTPLGSVKSSLRRALRMVQECLDDHR